MRSRKCIYYRLKKCFNWLKKKKKETYWLVGTNLYSSSHLSIELQPLLEGSCLITLSDLAENIERIVLKLGIYL